MIFSSIAASGFYVPTWFWIAVIVGGALLVGLVFALLWLIVRGAARVWSK